MMHGIIVVLLTIVHVLLLHIHAVHGIIVIHRCSYFVAAHSLGVCMMRGIIVVLSTVVHVVLQHIYAVHGIILVLFTVVHVFLLHIH